MKHICKKIKSPSGASMIIALLFMLVCVFVGGSVLVAATVNGSRIADDRKTQQGILDQRSACSVFSELLPVTDGKIATMTYTNDSGKIDYTHDYADTDTKQAKSNQLLQYIICETAAKTLSSTEAEQSMPFSITIPDGTQNGKVVNCEAVCQKNNYTVYIRFKENPQVQLKLWGKESSTTNENTKEISWYKGKIVKAEAAQ